MTDHKYIIKDGEVMMVTNLFQWASWVECAEWRLALTILGEGANQVGVSTVFLCLDYSFRSNRPVLFETQVFGQNVPALDGVQWRYGTIDQARRGHAIIVDKVREFLPDAEVKEVPCDFGAILPGREEKYAAMLKEHGLNPP